MCPPLPFLPPTNETPPATVQRQRAFSRGFDAGVVFGGVVTAAVLLFGALVIGIVVWRMNVSGCDLPGC